MKSTQVFTIQTSTRSSWSGLASMRTLASYAVCSRTRSIIFKTGRVTCFTSTDSTLTQRYCVISQCTYPRCRVVELCCCMTHECTNVILAFGVCGKNCLSSILVSIFFTAMGWELSTWGLMTTTFPAQSETCVRIPGCSRLCNSQSKTSLTHAPQVQTPWRYSMRN